MPSVKQGSIKSHFLSLWNDATWSPGSLANTLPTRLVSRLKSFFLYIKYIGFGLVGFYGILTIVGYLKPKPLYSYIFNIYMIWFGWVLWHINHCRLFNAKSSLCICIKYTWFGLVGFYGISTIVGYLMPNLLYTYILNIYNLVGLGFIAYQPL